MMILLISQRELIVWLCGREAPVAAGEPLFDEAFLELLEEQLDVSLELGRVLDAAGAEVAVDALLVELLEGELRHQALRQRDLVGRVFPINFLEAGSGQLVVVHLVLVLLVEDEVENLLGLVLVAHEGLPEESFDARDAGGVGGEEGGAEDVFDRDDQVFLVVVVGTGPDLPPSLQFLGRLARKVEGVPLRRTPRPQHPRLSGRGGGGLAQGLELKSFALSLLVALNREKLINRLFDRFFLFFGQETEFLGFAVLETLE